MAIGGLLVTSTLGCRGFGAVAVVDAAPDASRPAAEAGAGPPPSDAGPNQRTLLDECGPDNAAELNPEQVALLREQPTHDPTQRLLYPYADTVFPAGMMAPRVMWDGPTSVAVLLRLRSQRFEYTGCLPLTAAGAIAIPQHVWEALAAANLGPEDPIALQLTTLDDSGERASGPLALTFEIAAGAFPGTVYYMSYGSTQIATLWRLQGLASAEPLFSGAECAGCHTLSAQGTRLLGYARSTSSAYALTPDMQRDPDSVGSLLPGGENAAIAPDGSVYVASGHPLGFGPRARALSTYDAGLYELTTGLPIADANIPTGASVPAFSPSGRRLVFNDYGIASGHGLAVMDYDSATRSARGYRELWRNPTFYPGWPSFLPDESHVVFAGGITSDFAARGAQLPGGPSRGPTSDLHGVALATAKSTVLWRAMGFLRPDDDDADTYLPFGAEDLHQNYAPNVSSVQSGGYAWVFFDSVRHYGNLGLKRQLWGAAIGMAGEALDRSHPAFYVPGQDEAATNLRAVVVREPCAAGDSGCVTSR